MFIKSITFKVLSLVAFAFVLTAVGVTLIADRQLTRIIDASQNALYVEKLTMINSILHRVDNRLQNTGLVDAYVDDFKSSAINNLREKYYTGEKQLIFPFILDRDGRVVMHPALPYGNTSLQQEEWMQQMMAAESGNFTTRHLQRPVYYTYLRFSPWNWTICYSLPLDIKYADAHEFRNLLVYIMGGMTLLVLLALSWLISRITSPVSRLTAATRAMASGKLNQELKFGGNDEIGVLARSFIKMRDSIQQTISELKEENCKRRQVEMTLAAEKELLAVTLRSIGDGVITTDTDGKVVSINKVAEKLTGWLNESAAGQPCSRVLHIINEKKGQESQVDRAWDSGHNTGQENQKEACAKDGTVRLIAISDAPIRNRDSRVIGNVLVFRDITHEKKTEEELLKIRKLESVGVLAGGIAHDFNNVLTGILGNIELAGLNLVEENPNKAIILLDKAKKATQRAAKLTTQLLTFSKGGEPIREETSLADLIREYADFVLHGSNVICNYDFCDDLQMVAVDSGQIGQVIQNIIINAKQAMPEGGAVTIQCANTNDADAKKRLNMVKGNYVCVTIQDTGTGIPKKVIDKIFDPYFTTRKEGSGLGLAICHSIIRKHDGYLTVDTVEGLGTTFTVYLPAIPALEKITIENKGKKEEKEEAGSVEPLRIMVMDDDKMVCQVVEAILLDLGHEPITVINGNQAIDTCQKMQKLGTPVDLMILDLTIPGGMGGQEAARQLLQNDPDALMIVSSGYSNDPVMADYKKYGFCAAVAKPFDRHGLRDAISSAFERHTCST